MTINEIIDQFKDNGFEAETINNNGLLLVVRQRRFDDYGREYGLQNIVNVNLIESQETLNNIISYTTNEFEKAFETFEKESNIAV